MTSNELRNHFNKTFGLGEWPKTFEVDHETYANVCQAVIEYNSEEQGGMQLDLTVISIVIGKNKGIMFKNVELILKKEKK